MTGRQLTMVGVALAVGVLLWPVRGAGAQTDAGRVVHWAELEIDPAQLPQYLAALRKEIETSVRVEPGVMTLNAVAVKDHPEQIRVFEIYASREAYEAHLQSPHFKKYKSETAGMVRSLKLVETEPIVLRSKGAR